MKSERVVLIPTYNESENIARMIDTIISLPLEVDILIIDDGSPDGTASIVKERQKQYPDQLHLMERSGKLGLGTAYIAGFRWALEHGYAYIFEMDCDFSHPPHKLAELYEVCRSGQADVAVGSRYVKGGAVKNWPLSRILISYGASLYVRMITGIPVKDTTAGFVCYKREVLESMDLGSIRFKGYAFQIEMKYTAHALGFKVVEVPITFVDREFGASKMSSSIFGEGFVGVWALRRDKLMGHFPKGRHKQ